MTHARLTVPTRLLAGALAAAAVLAAAPAASAQLRPPATADTTAATSTAATGQAPANPPATDTTVRPAGGTATPTPPPPNAGSQPAGGATAGPGVDSLLTARARMGGRIRLRTHGVDDWAKTSANDPRKLVLYLDGRAMQGAVAQRVSGAGRPETWEVRLRRSDDARDAWEAVLGSPDSLTRHVRVGLGPAAGSEFASAPDSLVTLGLVVARSGWLWIIGLAWLGLIVGFIQLARTTPIIRDSPAPIDPPPGDPVPPTVVTTPTGGNPLVSTRRTERAERKRDLALRPYSLARTQMAFWFILVTTAFLAIWLITGDSVGVITTQALFLIGLGAGTALAAGVVERNQREVQAAAKPRMAALEASRQEMKARVAAMPIRPAEATTVEHEMRMEAERAMQRMEAESAVVENETPEAPANKGFFRDILSEKDGPALHRYQHFVWTLIVGVVFLVGAYQTLALPELDSTMLLLMGISAATYVGFKPREGQS